MGGRVGNRVQPHRVCPGPSPAPAMWPMRVTARVLNPHTAEQRIFSPQATACRQNSWSENCRCVRGRTPPGHRVRARVGDGWAGVRGTCPTRPNRCFRSWNLSARRPAAGTGRDGWAGFAQVTYMSTNDTPPRGPGPVHSALGCCGGGSGGGFASRGRDPRVGGRRARVTQPGGADVPPT